MRYYIYIPIIALLFASCNYFSDKEKLENVIVKVGETYLYKEDIKKILPKKISSKDSVLFVENYIDNWAKQVLLLEKAKINLEKNKKHELRKLVQKYEQDLLINSYKEAAVKEYLNDEITDSNITKYYAENSHHFKLNEELIQLKYLKFGKEIKQKKDFIKLFKSSESKDLDSLKNNEFSFKSYHFNDSTWIKYSDVLLKIPILITVDKKQWLKNNTFVKKEDSLDVHLIKVKKVRFKQQTAPKSFVKKTIKELILHSRKKAMLKDIEQKLLDDAKSQQKFQIITSTKTQTTP